MLKNKILYALLTICTATLLNSSNNTKLNEKLNIITTTRNRIESGIVNSSVQQLKGLTNELTEELKSLPQYLEQANDMLIVIKQNVPVTSGITSWKCEISKKDFFEKIHNIETICSQATSPKQFNQIINFIDDIMNYFVYNSKAV